MSVDNTVTITDLGTLSTTAKETNPINSSGYKDLVFLVKFHASYTGNVTFTLMNGPLDGAYVPSGESVTVACSGDMCTCALSNKPRTPTIKVRISSNSNTPVVDKLQIVLVNNDT